MHAALATAPGDAFASEPMDRTALERIATAMRTQADASLHLLEQQIDRLPEGSRAAAEAVLAARDALMARFDDVKRLAPDHAGARIRIHGDYHLGQVLRTEEDFVILDFEGEPARTIAERRAKQSALKDVAGMLRSFGYAAYAALLAFTLHSPAQYPLLESWADTWQHFACDAFLTGYRSGAGDASFLPRHDAGTTLLRAYALEKALYELSYELNNRPDWVRIPLIGLRKLIGT
jgi:maltose alpha-D-glucosyltransferase/alpha-amylase